MTLKEYFEAGNEVYYFTEEQNKELAAMLEEMMASYKAEQKRLEQKRV